MTYRQIFDRLDTWEPLAKKHDEAGRHMDAARVRGNVEEAKRTIMSYCPFDDLDQEVDVRRLTRMIYNLTAK